MYSVDLYYLSDSLWNGAGCTQGGSQSDGNTIYALFLGCISITYLICFSLSTDMLIINILHIKLYHPCTCPVHSLLGVTTLYHFPGLLSCLHQQLVSTLTVASLEAKRMATKHCPIFRHHCII